MEFPNFLALPDGINVFGLEIKFYAICIIIGMFLAYFYSIRITRKIGFDENDLFDGFIIGVILGIIGARLYYVIFSWSEYSSNPIKIITGIREGGLAIHGGVIAALIFIFFFVRKRKLNFYKLIELVAVGFLIGQIAGRWGNFFNQEANGSEVTRAFLESLHLPRFIINNMYFVDKVTYVKGYFHPTFLYESIWNICGLLFIINLRQLWKHYWIGDAGIFYLIWYGVGRFFVEALRTDPLPVKILGINLLQAQVISVVMVIIGVALLILRRVKKIYPVSYIQVVEENEDKNEELKVA